MVGPMRGITRGQPSQRSTQVRSLWKVESPGPSCRGRAGGGGVRAISAPETPGLGWPGARCMAGLGPGLPGIATRHNVTTKY